MSKHNRISALRKPARTAFAACGLGLAACFSAWASPVLIIRSNDLAADAPTVQAVTNLSALHVAAGNTVTVSVDLPVSLAGYSQVWDLGFRRGLDAADRAGYVSYLQQGGRLAVFGENVVFAGRNAGIRQLIADSGGGLVGNGPQLGNSLQTVRAPFNPSGDLASVNLLAPGAFDGPGRGNWLMALADDSFGSGLYFDPGDLVNAAAGTLLSVLDVDFLGNFEGQFGGAGGLLARNLVSTLTNGVTVQVPEPPAGALAALALLAAGLARRKPSRREASSAIPGR